MSRIHIMKRNYPKEYADFIQWFTGCPDCRGIDEYAAFRIYLKGMVDAEDAAAEDAAGEDI